MQVRNEVLRTAEDFEALLKREIEGPVTMVHLVWLPALRAGETGRKQFRRPCQCMYPRHFK